MAAHLLAASLALDRKNRTLNAYADALAQIGELNGAIQAYLDALALDPRDITAREGLQRMLHRRSFAYL
jgi:hypothetical protein